MMAVIQEGYDDRSCIWKINIVDRDSGVSQGAHTILTSESILTSELFFKDCLDKKIY